MHPGDEPKTRTLGKQVVEMATPRRHARHHYETHDLVQSWQTHGTHVHNGMCTNYFKLAIE